MAMDTTGVAVVAITSTNRLVATHVEIIHGPLLAVLAGIMNEMATLVGCGPLTAMLIQK